jgi:hypothetical protein
MIEREGKRREEKGSNCVETEQGWHDFPEKTQTKIASPG